MPTAQALEMLRPAEMPRLTKCVLTDAKFDTQRAAKTFNIEANYEPAPVELQTLANWSGLDAGSAAQLADGLELFAMRAIVERDGPFGYIILQRQPTDLNQRWPALEQEVGERLYMEIGEAGLLLNLRARGGSAFLHTLWELYESGAVYGFDDYSLTATLTAAARAVELSG